MMREVLALGPFLESLERRLDELPAEQLRQVLLEHGARLPVDVRPHWSRPPTPSATSPVAPAWPRSMPPGVSRCPTSTGCCPT